MRKKLGAEFWKPLREELEKERNRTQRRQQKEAKE